MYLISWNSRKRMRRGLTWMAPGRLPTEPSVSSALERLGAVGQGVVDKRIDWALLEGQELLFQALRKAATARPGDPVDPRASASHTWPDMEALRASMTELEEQVRTRIVQRPVVAVIAAGVSDNSLPVSSREAEGERCE